MTHLEGSDENSQCPTTDSEYAENDADTVRHLNLSILRERYRGLVVTKVLTSSTSGCGARCCQGRSSRFNFFVGRMSGAATD
jgi:hypothetical protein